MLVAEDEHSTNLACISNGNFLAGLNNLRSCGGYGSVGGHINCSVGINAVDHEIAVFYHDTRHAKAVCEVRFIEFGQFLKEYGLEFSIGVG